MKKDIESRTKSDALLQAIVSSTQDAIVIMEEFGKITFWNESAKKMFGYPSNEIIGKDLHSLITVVEEHRTKKSHLKKFFETGLSPVLGKVVELPARCKTGKKITIELTVSKAKFNDKWYAVGIMRDISEKKKIENLLLAKTKDLETIIDSSPIWIFYKDTENHFIRVNKSFATALKKKKNQLEGKSLFDIFTKQQANAYWQADKKVMAAGKPLVNIIEPMKSPEGTLWVQTDKVPLKDSNGKIIGIIGFARDVTKNKQLEDEFKTHTQELERMNNLMIEREMKMIELKKELEKLKR